MAKSKRSKLFEDPLSPSPRQLSLLPLPSVRENGTNFFPPILRTKEEIEALIDTAEGPVGTDLEFNPRTNLPSVLGVSTLGYTAGCVWDERLAARAVERVMRTGGTLVGHSVVGADRPVYEKALGMKIPLKYWDDTMIEFFLANSDFAKAPGKDEDEDDSGAVGLMGLWTMASLYTELPVWKSCRGKVCVGPCPSCDFVGYCAVDSWAGLKAHHELQTDLAVKGIPQKLYREVMEISEITEEMKAQGIKVNRAWVNSLEAQFEEKKAELFPVKTIGRKAVYEHFNPKSPTQIKQYFAKHKVDIKNTDRKEIYKTLEKACKKAKVKLEREDGQYCLVGDSVPEHLSALLKLYQFKNEGKGLKSWFDERYLDADDLLHPRFIPTGASTGRFSSSSPNFQSMPSRGFGELVRKAIIPRDPSLDIIKADFSQLELRMILYLAGVDAKDIGADAFMWLVEEAQRVLPGAFDRAAELASMSHRDIAKSVTHGGSYLEGIKVLSGAELSRLSVKEEIEAGALRMYQKKYMPKLEKDWEFRGGVVGFTGANLAERLFGNKTLESRRKALQIQEDVVYTAFPAVRRWQQKVLDSIQDNRAVKSPVGRYLPLYGRPEDDAKMAASFLGQGVSADHVQGIMLRYKRELGVIPLIQLHDELDFEIPKDWSDAKAKEFISLMGGETDRLPGFVGAFKAKRGPNWFEGEMRKI